VGRRRKDEVEADETAELPVVRSVEPIVVGEDARITMDKDGIAILIECKPNDRMKVAQDVFAYLEGLSDDGTVIIKNGACGNRLSIDDIDLFPSKARKCACGNPGHAFVRYKYI